MTDENLPINYGPNGTVCPFPLVYPPECKQFIGEALGGTFDAVQAVYVIISIGLIIPTSIQTYTYIKTHGFTPKTLQHKQIFLTAILALTFFIRSIDPGGLRGIIPLTLDGICYDVGTCCLLSMAFNQTWAWCVFLGKATFRTSITKMFHPFVVFSHIVIWLCVVILGILQIEVSPFWRYHSAKLFIISAFLFVWFFALVIYGIGVFRILQRALKKYANLTAPTSNATLERQSSAVSSITTNSEMGGSIMGITSGQAELAKPKRRDSTSRLNSANRMASVRRVIRMMTIVTLIMLVALILNLFLGTRSFARKTNYQTKPPDAPSGAGVIMEFIFDMVQWAGGFTSIHFYSTWRETRKKSQRSDSSQLSNEFSSKTKESVSSSHAASANDALEMSAVYSESDLGE